MILASFYCFIHAGTHLEFVLASPEDEIQAKKMQPEKVQDYSGCVNGAREGSAVRAPCCLFFICQVICSLRRFHNKDSQLSDNWQINKSFGFSASQWVLIWYTCLNAVSRLSVSYFYKWWQTIYASRRLLISSSQYGQCVLCIGVLKAETVIKECVFSCVYNVC